MSRAGNRLVSIIIPLFNEEKNVTFLVTAIQAVMNAQQTYTYELLLIDDGSSDKTFLLLQQIGRQFPNVYYVRLSRNFGHQNALKAGIDLAHGGCTITMDGDGQHPPELLVALLQKWEEGYDVVYTRRTITQNIKRTKKYSSSHYYRLLNRLSDVELEEGTADFRLLDQKVVAVLKRTQEADLFLRGMVKWVGFQQYAIDYAAPERYAGETKYTTRKMLSFALRGIISFSIKPLYVATYLGLIFACGAALYLPYILFSYFSGDAVSGWSSLIATVVFFGGLQLLIMGIIGIYVGKTFLQVKNRPHYLIQETNLT
ncbi:MAG: glycosyltransferase family 2 protein [Chitinophagaceae bacterium]